MSTTGLRCPEANRKLWVCRVMRPVECASNLSFARRAISNLDTARNGAIGFCLTYRRLSEITKFLAQLVINLDITQYKRRPLLR
jgi:hypothetical protein